MEIAPEAIDHLKKIVLFSTTQPNLMSLFGLILFHLQFIDP